MGTDDRSLRNGVVSATRVRFTELIDVNPKVDVVGLAPNDEVSFIPMSDVTDGGQWAERQTRKLREVQNGYSTFQEGDILFAKITPCTENGKGCHATGLANGVGFGSTEFHVLRAKPGINPRLVYHISVSRDVRAKAAAMMGGSAGQQRVPPDFFKHLWLTYSWKNIQDELARLLDSVDEAIEATRAVIEQTRRLKSALLQELLTKGLPGRHKKFRLDRDFGRIPADWRVESLQSIAVPGSICYGVVQPGDEARDGIPLIRVCDIESAEINIPNLKRISPEVASNYRRSELKGGELLISLVGTIGRCTIAPPETKGFNIARAIAKVELKKTVNARFVLHVLNSAANQKLTGGAFQSARSTLNLAELAKIRVLQPEPGEQNRIAEVIDTIEGQEKIETDRLQQLLTFKSALSQGLLTGKIPVPIPPAESAASQGRDARKTQKD